MSTDPPRFLFTVPGPPRVLDRVRGQEVDLPLGKPMAALAYVALEGTRVTRNDLATLLWPEAPAERARASVRQALWLLRKRIHPAAVVEDDRGGLALDPTVLGTDLSTFEDLLRTGTPEAVAEAWDRWQGGMLEGLAIADAPGWQSWADTLRAQWERRFGEALEEAALHTRGATHLAWIERALEVRPFRELLHGARVRALLDLGRVDEAERALRRYRDIVDEPDPERLDGLDEALRSLKRRALEEPEDRLRTEFVGRSQEFARLSGVWRSALSGRPRTVALVGPTGIGKSRLAQEFAARAQAEGAAVVEAKALDVERALDLGIAGTLVRVLLSLPGAAGISIGSAEVLETLVPSRRRTSGPAGTAPAAALADALTDLLEAVAHETPLVLLLEDAHWADTPSRALLLRAVRGLRSTRLLMLWTCRSDTADSSVLRTLAATEKAGSAATLTLAPLSPAEVAELLGLLVTSRTEAVDVLAGRLHEASGGNPLHVVELLRALQGDGVLRYETATGWRLGDVALPDTLTLPLSVRQALERRLSHLSDGARALAALLATASEPLSADELLELSAEAGGGSADALTELLQRDVVRWTRDDRLDFAHDSIREAVAHTGTPVAGRHRGRARALAPWLTSAAALAMLAVGGWLGLGPSVAPADDLRSRYGGVLWARTQTALFRLEMDTGGWVLVDSITLPEDLAHVEPFVDRDGEVRLYATRSSVLRGPDIVEWRKGTVDTLLALPGDDGVQAVSPDGRHLLITTEDVDHPTWLIELHRFDPRTGETRLIHRPSHQTRGVAWHPDGDRIAVGVSEPGAPDSIVFYDPSGRRTGGIAAPPGRLSAVEPCGDRMIVTTTSAGRRPTLWLVEWDGAMERLEVLERATSNARWRVCAPTGDALAYLPTGDLETLAMVDLGTGAVEAVPAPRLAGVTHIRWTLPSPKTLPARVELPADTLRVPWGGELDLPARVHFSDGAVRRTALALESRDPGILGFRDDRLVGNAPGITTLVATAAGWITDSVVVRVEGALPDQALWADRFDTLDTSRWTPIGHPTVAPRRLDGQPVLELLGDGVWLDGIFSEPIVSLEGGATIELEFRLPLSRTDRQSISVCLSSADPPDDPASATGMPRTLVDTQVCIKYPADELSRFDPAEVVLWLDGLTLGSQSFPDDLPAPDWTHLGLQIGADGRLGLVLNQRLAHTYPADLRVDPRRPLRVIVTGRAVETELLIRNLIVWRGLRYQPQGERPRAEVSTPAGPPGTAPGRSPPS
jgi:DNA-binding SARP family transcriptional activator